MHVVVSAGERDVAVSAIANPRLKIAPVIIAVVAKAGVTYCSGAKLGLSGWGVAWQSYQFSTARGPIFSIRVMKSLSVANMRRRSSWAIRLSIGLLVSTPYLYGI